MSDRKTHTITEAAHEAADATRQDDESWTEWTLRAVEALEGPDDSTEHESNTVAVENVDEIARRAAEEVENRMTRR